MTGKPFTRRTSKAGKATRFGKDRPGKARIPRAYRPKKFGKFNPLEVERLASQGCEVADIQAALGIGPDHGAELQAIVAAGHSDFVEKLTEALREEAHSGSPRALQAAAGLYLKDRYGSRPSDAQEEAVSPARALAAVEAWNRDVTERAREQGLDVDAYLSSLKGGAK